MQDPYVPTTRGWRRKIGPASKYRFNDAPQNGEDGTKYGNHPGSRFTGQTKVGMMTGPRRESNFQTSLREAREISEANAAMERREKQRTNQAKQAEAAKKAASTAPSSAEKNAAGVAAFGSGKPPAATQSAPQAPVMSREERNKIEEERRAKGRAKAEAERPGGLKAKMEAARTGPKPLPTYDPKAPKMSSQPPDPLRREESKPDFMKRMVAESNARKASSTGQEPKVSYSSPAPSGSNFGAARSRAAQAAAPEKKQATAPAAKAATPAPKPRPGSAVPQAVKNPQGLSARFNPPGSKPKTLEEDPIAKPFLAAGRAVVSAAKKGKRYIAAQGTKNPQGLSARISRLLN